ncbi:hypothetical protein [Pseudomonas sp. JAI120]|uniref:hypothetical protein n=1 Tax=Pseudomonas sp. JAI120 TaxID=2723063 RepID=UPI0030D71745
MNIDEDTCKWLGCPTPLEMYKHQCVMPQDEIANLHQQLRSARENIQRLIQMKDHMATDKASTETDSRRHSTISPGLTWKNPNRVGESAALNWSPISATTC